MQIHVSCRNLKLTGAINLYIAGKLHQIEHIAEDIIGAHVVLLHDETKAASKSFGVKVHLGVPGPDIHLEEYDRDLYAAIDKIETKLARQLRKRKTKTKERRLHKMKKSAERRRKSGRSVA